MATIKITFGKGGIIEVRHGRKITQFKEDSEALGYAYALGFDDRDQPCIQLPPNLIVNHFLDLDPESDSRRLFNRGSDKVFLGGST